jgi:hypothetical protein
MRPRPTPTPLAACAVVLLCVAGWAAACSTQESPSESHGDCVAGGCQQGSGSSSASSTSGACTPDPGCAVKWGTDIFTGILDGPAGCTTMACHGTGKGGITLASGQSAAAYTALTGYTLLASPGPAKPYIVPCDPAGSGFPCNMAVAADAGANPSGTCGTLMPFGAGTTPLTLDQVTKIGDWIKCGAPEN